MEDKKMQNLASTQSSDSSIDRLMAQCVRGGSALRIEVTEQPPMVDVWWNFNTSKKWPWHGMGGSQQEVKGGRYSMALKKALKFVITQQRQVNEQREKENGGH